jgi:putative oxidoreductase
MDAAILIVRIILGLALAAHGAQKLFGWFGGYGISGTGGFFEGLGFRPGRLFAFLAGAGEFGGGALTAIGLSGPIGPALIIVVMIVAAITVHLKNGFFAANNGYELPLMNIAAALAVLFAGPGAYSVDALLGFSWLSTPTAHWAVLGIAIVLALLNVGLRKTAPAPTPVAQS